MHAYCTTLHILIPIKAVSEKALGILHYRESPPAFPLEQIVSRMTHFIHDQDSRGQGIPHLGMWMPSKQSFCQSPPDTLSPYDPYDENYPFFSDFFIIVFPLPFILPIAASPQQSPHCCPYPWVLFSFCSIPQPPNLPPELSVGSLMSLSLFCL